jgi:hypothetical protein
MDIAPVVPSCISAKTPCNGTCSGYGTTCNCPPLIVVAMLLAEAAAGGPNGWYEKRILDRADEEKESTI